MNVTEAIHLSLVGFGRSFMMCGIKAEKLHVYQWGWGTQVTCKRCLATQHKIKREI